MLEKLKRIWKHGTEGQVNRLSDDLISREAAVELVIAEYDRFQANGGSHSGRYELDKVIKMLQNMTTAFDKEKVIEELNNSFERSVAEILDYIGSGYTIADFSLEKFKRKICCIVEKGGIEEE